MKAELLNKPGAEPGWALIRLSFDEGAPKAPQAGERFEVALQEWPSKKHFQASEPHWEGLSEWYFEPHGQNFDGRVLALELGPRVTGTFKKDRTYFFHIRGDQGFNDKFNTPVENLNLSNSGLIDVEVGGPRTSPTLTEAEPVGAEPAGAEPAGPEPAEPQAEAEPAEPPWPEPPPVPKNRTVRWLALAILILGLVGLGGLFWMRAGKTPDPPPPAAPDSPPPAAIAPPPPAAAGPAEPAAQAESGPVSLVPPLEEARELLRRGADTAELEAALARLEARPGAEDAVFLLTKALAPRAVKYRVRYAAFMDPADTRPSGSIKKDPLAAREEYEAAKAAGAPEAALALERLGQWAEEHAEKGDPEAVRFRRLYGGNKP